MKKFVQWFLRTWIGRKIAEKINRGALNEQRKNWMFFYSAILGREIEISIEEIPSRPECPHEICTLFIGMSSIPSTEILENIIEWLQLDEFKGLDVSSIQNDLNGDRSIYAVWVCNIEELSIQERLLYEFMMVTETDFASPWFFEFCTKLSQTTHSSSIVEK